MLRLNVDSGGYVVVSAARPVPAREKVGRFEIYVPVKRGGRFSAKAAIPSWKSAVRTMSR